MSISTPVPSFHPAILWIDIETTGLQPGTDAILELAYIATDIRGNILETPDGYPIKDSFLIKPSLYSSQFQRMTEFLFSEEDAYVRKMHHDNNLLHELFQDSAPKLTIDEVEAELRNAVTLAQQAHPEINFWYLGGSSVHTDRAHLEANGVTLPVNHRHLDMSSVRLAFVAAGQTLPDTREAGSEHRALHDITADLETYRSALQILDTKEDINE